MDEVGAKTDRTPNHLLSLATVGGRSHRIWRQNCHDAAYCGNRQRQDAYWGLVLDGCGSKTARAGGRIPSHNEVGAKLSGQFVTNWWDDRFRQEEAHSLVELLPLLYRDYLTFLERSLQLFTWTGDEERGAFCHSHLLTTLVGFVVTSTEAAFFWRGDGYLCYDGMVLALEAGNRPAYPAYDLLAGGGEGGFQSLFLERQSLSWLAVASDGWRPELLGELAEPRSALALQRWLNVQARERGNFDDDGAVAALYLGEQGSRIGQIAKDTPAPAPSSAGG